jgi:hypothetical protein
MGSPGSILETATKAGWPRELADKLLEARLPASEQEHPHADDAPSLSATQKIVDVAYRLAHGSARAREVPGWTLMASAA